MLTLFINLLILFITSLLFINFLFFFDKNRRPTTFAMHPFGIGENFLFDDFKNIAIL